MIVLCTLTESRWNEIKYVKWGKGLLRAVRILLLSLFFVILALLTWQTYWNGVSLCLCDSWMLWVVVPHWAQAHSVHFVFLTGNNLLDLWFWRMSWASLDILYSSSMIGNPKCILNWMFPFWFVNVRIWYINVFNHVHVLFWFVNVHFQGSYEVTCIQSGFGQVRNLNEEGKILAGKFCSGIRPRICDAPTSP